MGLVGYTGIHIRMDKGLAIWMWEGCKKTYLQETMLFLSTLISQARFQLITNIPQFPKQKQMNRRNGQWK